MLVVVAVALPSLLAFAALNNALYYHIPPILINNTYTMQSRMGSSIPDGFAIPVDVNSFRRLNYTQAILLFLDLIFTLLGENNTRSSIVPSAAVYLYVL